MWKLIGKGLLCAGALLISTLSGIYAKNQAQDIMKGSNKKEKRRDFNRDNRPKPEFKKKPKGPEMK